MPVGGTAYFRDVAWEATYTLQATADNDHWSSSIAIPGAGSLQFAESRYRSTFNGESDCWFLGGVLQFCGTTEVIIENILSIQCGTSGAYTFTLFENGGQVFSGSFSLKPTLPPGSFQPAFQTAFPDDQYDSLCFVTGDPENRTHRCLPDGDETKASIKAKGCALTAVEMVLNYFGGTDDPKTLNDYLNSLPLGDGYDNNGAVVWSALEQRVNQGNPNITIRMTKPGAVSPAELRNRICRFGPQIVQVSNKHPDGSVSTHFVMVTGLNEAGDNFTIADPAYPDRLTLRPSYDGYVSVREVEPNSQPTWDALLKASAYSPVELVITDPLGRRTGYDPLTGQDFVEIPGAAYDSSGLGTLLDDGTMKQFDPLWKEVEVRPAMDGDYTIRVTGAGSGTYTLSVLGYDQEHRSSTFRAEEVGISVGEVHEYMVRFSATDMSGGELAAAGGFAGGGQRSAVNALLSYARPAQSHTSLPAGSTTYAVMIFYDAVIDPTTFQADLGGVDVGALFHPLPGTSETVSIPLQSGRNVLKLLVTGNPEGRAGTDRDQLTFIVP